MKNLPVLLKRTPFSDSTTITGAGIKSFGNNVILWAKTDDNLQGIELRTDRRVLLEILHQIIERLDVPEKPDAPKRANRVTPAMESQLANWDWLTPQMVIDKFRASPNLRPMLDDVIAVLGDTGASANVAIDAEQVKSRVNVDNLFRPDGSLKRGAQSKIADALGIKNAGGHRRRIFRVLDELKAA